MPSAPVRVPTQRPLAPSVALVANNKGDTEMILEAVHRSPGIYFTAEENHGKPRNTAHEIYFWIKTVNVNALKDVKCSKSQ